MKRKDRTAEKRQPIPKRFSGDGSAPPRLSVWFSALFLLPFRGVCLAAARVSAAHLSMPSTRHGAKCINLINQDINSIFIALPFSFSNKEIDFSMSD